MDVVENSNLTKAGEIVLLGVAVSMVHSVGTENEFQRSCAAETALSVVVELHHGGRWTSNAKDPLIHCITSILFFIQWFRCKDSCGSPHQLVPTTEVQLVMVGSRWCNTQTQI